MSVPSAEVPEGAVLVVVDLGRRRIPTPVARDVLATRLRQVPPHPADVAQSQLFETILLAEIDELEDRAAAVERRRQRRADRSTNGVGTPAEELKQLSRRIADARRLLAALHRRFPLD